MRIIKALITLFFVGMITVGCTSGNEVATDAEETALTVYTTIYPIQYAVEQIGGDTVKVNAVIPPGGDAHTAELTQKDMTSIAESDAFIYLGAGMEGFAETAAGALASQKVKLIEIGKHDELFHADEEGHTEELHDHEEEEGHIEELHDHEEEEGHTEESHDHEEEEARTEESHDHEGEKDNTEESHDHEEEEAHTEESHDGHYHGDYDPHIWLDPLRMVEVVEIIKDELITLNPEEEAIYNENFETLEANLIALNDQFTEVLGEKENKQILVSHAAFGYWKERYDIEQIAVNGLSTENEPSQKELTEIIDLAKEYNLEYILFEQNSSNRVSKIIQDEIGLKELSIHTLQVLTDEDLNNKEDYISIMKHNLEVLDKATK
ncbi:metal ABC transporter solute-binding protein, Zn/Mn family [Oceanobacillus salinisoli]|uniref:metal ABC transporter solute-binding protein, Zn/Mn family n=1 Tax=Oceanobacillus salinisoli TaxID=2678611 RepID=UPI0012E1FE3B|nr:zinc ABC transporter substrate-binding protein [Oceanobacillus salinisoli]